MPEFLKAIHPTECVSYPRSGHHGLVDVLRAYFADAFVYCESYDTPEKKLGLPGGALTNFQKNHDFELSTPVLPDRQYLIQIRHPLQAIESWDELDRRAGYPAQPQENKLGFWTAFVNKWVLAPIPRRLVVDYADLVERPTSTMVSVIQFLIHHQRVDMELLERSLARFPLVRRPPLKPTRYLSA